MAITYPIQIPATPGFRSIKWMLDSAVGEQVNKYTFEQVVYAWSGQLRRVTVELPTMTEENAKLWMAWAMKLNGKEGTFYLKDSLYMAPQGEVADSYSGGLVNGASQITTELATDGWGNSVTDLFKAGDWISIGNRLYNILEDADSNGSGECDLEIWPKAAAFADNAVISVGSAAQGVFRLDSWPDWGWDVDRYCSGFTFTAKEAL